MPFDSSPGYAPAPVVTVKVKVGDKVMVRVRNRVGKLASEG